MPKYLLELEGTDIEGDGRTYVFEFPNLVAAWQEAQRAATEWIAYAEEHSVPIEPYQQFNIYDDRSEIVGIVPFYPNTTIH